MRRTILLGIFILSIIITYLVITMITTKSSKVVKVDCMMPENENSYYDFNLNAIKGENISREPFAIITNGVTNTKSMNTSSYYFEGTLNSIGQDSVVLANSKSLNGGKTCSSLPSKIYIPSITPNDASTLFCANPLNITDYYPLNKPVSINIGTSTNPNVISLTPNTTNTCVLDIMYNLSGIPPTIAPRKPIIDSGWGDNLSFFPINKGWYDIIGQGAKNDYCRFVGGWSKDNLACILSKDRINSTSKFGDTNNYSTTYKGVNVLDIAKKQTPGQ